MFREILFEQFFATFLNPTESSDVYTVVLEVLTNLDSLARVITPEGLVRTIDHQLIADP